MQWPKSVAIYQKWLQKTKLQRKIFVGRRCHSNRGERFAQRLILVLQQVFPYCNTKECCCNAMQCCNPQYRQPWWVLQQLLLQHTRCCQKYLLSRTQSVAIGALATILDVAIDLIATHQQHCNRWTLYCHAISVVAIGGTIYCHDKYLVARGSLSIATINTDSKHCGCYRCLRLLPR